jgi:hypothetical protein
MPMFPSDGARTNTSVPIQRQPDITALAGTGESGVLAVEPQPGRISSASPSQPFADNSA